MKEHVPSEPARTSEDRQVKPAVGQDVGVRLTPASPSQALALQRLAGNRATVRVLARWSKHPDETKKGVLMPDVVAAEFLRFNPPKNQ